MRQLVETPRFRRMFRKHVRRNPALRVRIEQTLHLMSEDAFAPSLATHKLSGDLFGLLACSCGYDCGIIFTIEVDDVAQQEVILLLSIGTHEEVY